MEGVLHERPEASDERCLKWVRGFSLFRVPGFIVNVTRIFSIRSHDDFASAGFSIRKNGYVQNIGECCDYSMSMSVDST